MPPRPRAHRRASARKEGRRYAWEETKAPRSESPGTTIVQAFKSPDYIVLVVHQEMIAGPPWTRLVIQRHDKKVIGRKTGAVAVAANISNDLVPGTRPLLDLKRTTDRLLSVWIPPLQWVWPPEACS